MIGRSVHELGEDVWAWRLETSLRTADDIPRVDRPLRWLPAFSPPSVDERRQRAEGLRERWARLDVREAPVEVQVNHRLLGSALARVTWEFDILRNWERNAVLQAEQAIGPYFDLLLRPPPFDADRQAGLMHVLEHVPAQLEVARSNLRRAGVAPLAQAAVRLLSDIDTALLASVKALADFVDVDRRDALRAVGREAAAALADHRDWLAGSADGMAGLEPVGREGFAWFLTKVALLPRQPEELVLIAEREYDRAVVWEEIERNRRRDVPLPALPADAARQAAVQARLEEQVRSFYEREGLLSQPASLHHYLTAPIPSYLAPISWLGVTDDLTYEGRLHEDGVSYTPEPRSDLPYFHAANARDPRLGIVHEGAHYQQLALAWAHPDPIRRRYYDSIPNEGIAFYNEEFLLQAGLFEDAPRSVEIIHNFNKLRSLRVVVDVNLATGRYDIEDGVAAFVELVPMDEATAFEETVSYIANPGHAMTYLVGKSEVLRLQSDAIRRFGPSFSYAGSTIMSGVMGTSRSHSSGGNCWATGATLRRSTPSPRPSESVCRRRRPGTLLGHNPSLRAAVSERLVRPASAGVVSRSSRSAWSRSSTKVPPDQSRQRVRPGSADASLTTPTSAPQRGRLGAHPESSVGLRPSGHHVHGRSRARSTIAMT